MMAASGPIDSIWTASTSASEMVQRETVTLLKDRGIEGDRYCLGQGTYSALKEKGRQLTLLSADGAEAALAAGGIALDGPLGCLRRNIVLRGISAEGLLAARGHVVSLGDACAVFVHRNCVPCAYNEAYNRKHGLMDALWGAGGVNCEVVRGGKLRQGDTWRIDPARDLALCDDAKPETFYIRPKLRTKEMLRSSTQALVHLYERLLPMDPDGVERLAAAYSSVGLTFWPRSVTFGMRAARARKCARSGSSNHLNFPSYLPMRSL